MRDANPLYRLILLVVGVLVSECIQASVLVARIDAATTIEVEGWKLHTSSLAVAFIALALLMNGVTVKAILNNEKERTSLTNRLGASIKARNTHPRRRRRSRSRRVGLHQGNVGRRFGRRRSAAPPRGSPQGRGHGRTHRPA